ALDRSASVYFNVGTYLNLVWFRDQIASDSREGQWNNLARLSLRDELDNLQRRLSIVILKYSKKSTADKDLVDEWVKENPGILSRWELLLHQLHESPNIDYTLFFIVLRELSAMIVEWELA
ncbi:MAG: NAD-glutamate dehydrogenase, partial [Legionellales bacterium]